MILVDVYVPVLNDTFDFQLDENVPAGLLVSEMAAIILKKFKCEDMCMPSDLELYDTENTGLIMSEATLAEVGIKDGCRLMLI